MKRYVEGDDRNQISLTPLCFEDMIGEDNPVRAGKCAKYKGGEERWRKRRIYSQSLR